MRNSLKYIFIGLVLLACNSCVNDTLDELARPSVSADAISFGVTSGVTSEMGTRHNTCDDADLLEPLVLSSSDADFPLYLHTYVKDIDECDTYGQRTTRAAQVNDITDFVSLNKNDGFHIKAYDDDNRAIIPRYAVAKPQSDNTSESVWNTTPTYYWPVDDRLLYFYAYAPMAEADLLQAMAVDNTYKTISFDYEAPRGMMNGDDHIDAESQPDIMFAMAECNKSMSIDGKVPMNFRHALSAIKFAVRDVVEGTIEQIKIKGVAGKAHCVYTKTSDPATDEFVWTNYEERGSTYVQTFDYVTTNKTSGDEILTDRMPSKTFMLIPQEIPEDAEIEIVFSRTNDPKTFTLKGKIRDNNVTHWEPGKEYIYTISTTSSNWTYHFNILGSEQTPNINEPSSGVFIDGDSIILNQTVTTGAYFKVQSYRERTNNHRDKEPVAWYISNISDGVIIPPEYFDFDVATPDLAPDKWIPTKTMNGAGSIDFQPYNMVFAPQMAVTDYEGDAELQRRDEYGSASAPVDLSTVNGTMNTANCYVVNASGYFKFPLVYGNAIKSGQTNSSCYSYTAPTVNSYASTYPSLTNFVDYKGNAITSPKITGAADAILVWEDAYNLISNVKLNAQDGAYGTVSFKVNREDLQQGNAVIAIRDASGVIIWSWHIWITEHWSDEGSLQLTGDIAVNTYDSGLVANDKYYAAPRNLGWCDPKDVWYLQRVGNITFKQADSGYSEKINVKQREAEIEYWIGNNTYYQFGRKDPIVGFMNDQSVVKYNFGTYPYMMEPQTKSLQEGIQKPNVLFVGAAHAAENNDWSSVSYHNLWNNSSEFATTAPTTDNAVAYHYSSVKTVYDPCPAGYMVPPLGFFKNITNGNGNDSANDLIFNGTKGTDERGNTVYYVNTATPGVYLNLYGTGHRWYANGGAASAGANFGPTCCYLWSSNIVFNIGSAYGLALGGDYDTSNFHFVGRRAMARPVRPIREL